MPSPGDLYGMLPQGAQDYLKDGAWQMAKKHSGKILGGLGAAGLAALAGWGMSKSNAPTKPNMTRKSNRWDESGNPYEGAETAADYVGDTFTRGVPKLIGGIEDAWDNGPQKWIDWADWQTGGIARPLLYAGLTGAAGYGVGRMLGGTDFLKEKFYKNKTWEEQQGDSPRMFNVQSQSEEFTNFMKKLKKTPEGRKQAERMYQAMKRYAANKDFNPASIASTDVAELATKFPDLFGASGFAWKNKAPMLEQGKKTGELRRGIEKTDIPLMGNPALEYIRDTKKYRIRDINQVFAEYHKDIASPFMRDLHNRAFGGGVKDFDKNGVPIYDDSALGEAGKYLNPRKLYNKYLNEFYQKSLGIKDPALYGDKEIVMPSTHPYQMAVGKQNRKALRLIPDQEMNASELRDFLGRHHGLFGGETPDMIDMIAGNRFIGGRKATLSGQPKPMDKNHSFFPWSAELMSDRNNPGWKTKQVMAADPTLDRKWNATVGNMTAIQIPKYAKPGEKMYSMEGYLKNPIQGPDGKQIFNPKDVGYDSEQQLLAAIQGGTYQEAGRPYPKNVRPDFSKLPKPEGMSDEEWNWEGRSYPYDNPSVVTSSGKNRDVEDLLTPEALAYQNLNKTDWLKKYGQFSRRLTLPYRQEQALLNRKLGINPLNGMSQKGFDNTRRQIQGWQAGNVKPNVLERESINYMDPVPSSTHPIHYNEPNNYRNVANLIRNQNNEMAQAFGLLYGDNYSKTPV